MKRILYIITEGIEMIDIPLTLETMGFCVEIYHTQKGIKDYSPDDKAILCHIIEEKEPDYVFSCDFSMAISEVCFWLGLPYISWVYDCPQAELYSVQALYETNYIFVFDKMQCERIRKIGVKHIYHTPLAIYPDRIRVALQKVKKEYNYEDICFIGQLYRANNNERIIELLNDKGKSLWEETISKCYMKWDEDSSMYGLMGKELLDLFSSIPYSAKKKYTPFMSEAFRYETAVLSRHIAHRERIHILNKLAQKYKVTFYTFDENLEGLCKEVDVKPGMSYSDYSIFQIYNSAKININISLHCIESGIPQRVFDVMASGGFMLTNNQKEIEDLFVIGEDIEVFHSESELFDKVNYYLEHENERKRIAKRGQKKVLELHSYKKRFEGVFEIVDKDEPNRNELLGSYLNKASKIQEDQNSKRRILDDALESENALNAMQFIYFHNQNEDIVKLYLAYAYMEKALWGLALDALNLIEKPNNEILQIINQLQQLE